MELTKIKKNVVSKEEKKILKVAAYTRVSKLEKNGFSSIHNQKMYYQNLIMEHDNWEFVNLYSDEGISGGSTKKRKNFLRMIVDADNGKIDLILTKSISRFARNTLDTIKYVRYLKDRNIGVFFEEENINTLNINSEMILSILSSIAQQEIENLSENVKYGLRQNMKEVKITSRYAPYGYRFNKESNNLELDEYESKIVKKIFQYYLESNSAQDVIRKLYADGCKPRNGKELWSGTSILDILKNVAYTGDLILQKYYNNNPYEKIHKKNKGQLDKYLVRNHHEPIVDKETFDKVQEKIKQRAKVPSSNLNLYTGFVRCGLCGSYLKKSRCGKVNYFKCSTKDYVVKDYCPSSKYVRESQITESIEETYKRIKKLTTTNITGILYLKKLLYGYKSITRDIIEKSIHGILIGTDESPLDLIIVLRSNNLIKNKLDDKFYKANKGIYLFNFYTDRVIYSYNKDKSCKKYTGYKTTVYVEV